MDNSDKLKKFATALMKMRTAEETTALLQDIFTKAEQETIALRWEVVELLNIGTPYTEIERQTGASSATIAKVSEFLKYGYGGYRVALDRLAKKR